MKWLDSYSNHILHCSLYAGVSAYFLKCSTRSTASSSSSLSWSTALPLLASGVAAVNLFAEISYIVKRLGLPSGDSGLPILGHVASWFTSPRRFFMNRSCKYGTPFTINVLMRPFVFFSGDEDVRWVMTQERKGNLIPSLPASYQIELAGEEVITIQSGSNHRRLRKIFEPSFSPSAIQDYVQVIDDTATSELEKWCARDDFCSAVEWAVLAMRLFFTCAFGQVSDDRLERLHNSIQAWLDGFIAPPLRIPGTTFYRAFAARQEAYSEIQTMVDDFKQKNPPGSPGAEHGMLGRLCYGVDDDGNTLTDAQLIQNLLFIVFAGHDTTKGSFGSFAHFLTAHPKLHNMLLNEVASFSEPLDIDELKTAPLLNAFLAETWRLIPPTDTHKLEATTDLTYKGYTIPTGVAVLVDITCEGVCNEARFPDPMEFRVERWLPKDHPMYDARYATEGIDYNVMSVKYRAFNMGAHMCLGAHFAKLEARVVLTRLLQNYTIEIRNDTLVESPFLQYRNEFKLTKRCP